MATDGAECPVLYKLRSARVSLPEAASPPDESEALVAWGALEYERRDITSVKLWDCCKLQ